MSNASPIDAYLELNAGQKIIKGETLDAVFGDPSKAAIQVLSFELNFNKNDYVADEDDREIMDVLQERTGVSGSNTKPLTPAELKELIEAKKRKKKGPLYSFTVTKFCDASSPKLFTLHTEYLQRPLSVSTGGAGNNTALLDQATLTFRKAGGGMVTYFVCYFANLLITDYRLDATSEHPRETVVLSFERCELNYVPQSAHGDAVTSKKGKHGWNFADNVPWGS